MSDATLEALKELKLVWVSMNQHLVRLAALEARLDAIDRTEYISMETLNKQMAAARRSGQMTTLSDGKPNPRDVWIMDRLDKLEAQVRELQGLPDISEASSVWAMEPGGLRRVDNDGNAPPRPLEDDEVFHDGVIWQLDPELMKALKRG